MFPDYCIFPVVKLARMLKRDVPTPRVEEHPFSVPEGRHTRLKWVNATNDYLVELVVYPDRTAKVVAATARGNSWATYSYWLKSMNAEGINRMFEALD